MRVAAWFLKGVEARETLVRALDGYFRTGSHKRGSPIVNAHYPLFASNVDTSDVARFECANALGSLSNTASTTFWAAWHIFTDPMLLSSIRDEISSITDTIYDPDGNTTHQIDVKKLREDTVLFLYCRRSLSVSRD